MRHEDVDDDHVGRHFEHQIQAGTAVGREAGVVLCFGQDEPEQFARIDIVIDDHHATHGCLLDRRRSEIATRETSSTVVVASLILAGQLADPFHSKTRTNLA